MHRMLVILVLLVAVLKVDGQPTDPGKGSGPLEKARGYYGEKSWQLAVNVADEADTATLSVDANRELSYIKALALQEMKRSDALADGILKQIVAENDSDVWAGRAYWHLQDGLAGQRWLDTNTTDPLKELRAADRILTDLKPDDLEAFYRAVIDSQLATMNFPKKDDREYILSFFDKVMPLLKGKEDWIAAVQLRRQAALDVQRSERTPEERLAGLRGIVAEFPKTKSAAQAQWLVAQHYIGQNELVPALYELGLLTNQFAGTDEARRAMEEIERIRQPEAAFSLSGQYVPGEKIEFELAARNTDEVKFTAVAFDIIKELKKKDGIKPDLAAASGKGEFTQKFDIDKKDDYQPTTRSVTLDFGKKAGVYVLRAEAGGKVTCNALLVVSDLVLVGNTGPKGYEMWAVDATTGKPRAGAQVTVAHNLQRKNQWVTGKQINFFEDYASLTTDHDGFADFTNKNDNRSFFVVATSGDSVAFLDNLYWSPFNQGDESRPFAYLYTDRPVYRPEQKVYWRAIVRERNDGLYVMPDTDKGKAYHVIIRDPQGQEVLNKQGLTLSEFGTVDGEVTLQTGAPLGMYSIFLEETSSNQYVGNGNFRVEEYKKPEFEVSVEAADDFAKVGQKVTAKVEAKYLFGSPVTDGTVKYTVRRRPHYSVWWEFLTWHLDDRDLGWFEQAPERPPVLHGSGGTIVTQGEGKLNADGSFDLTFDSTVPDNELEQNVQPLGRGGFQRYIWPPHQPSTWDFQVEVTVTDASRRNIDASQIIPVGLKALKLAAKTQRQIVTPGDNARVELKSVNLADKPVPSSGTLYVEKLVWNETAKDNDITTVSEQTVVIESSGSLVMDWRVPADLHGSLRFAYITDDPFGGKSVAYANFFAASTDDTDVETRYQGIEIIADKTQYIVGETARLMILSEYKDAAIWYWEDAGSGSLKKQVMPLPHRTNFVTIPITEAYVPNSMVHIVGVRDKKIITDEVELIVPPTSKVIKVEVTPTEDSVEPGQTGEVTVRATDEDGWPVRAEFSLSIFDQAITYIAPDTREDIRKTFYGMRRALRSEVRASVNEPGSYGGILLEGGARYLRYRPRITGLPDIMVGDAERSAGYNTAYSMNFYAGEDINLRMLKAESPASASGRAGAMEMAVAAPAMMAPPPPASAIMDEAPAKKSKQDADAEQPVIRSDFRDSMFWSPTVRTDAAGSATVEIKYPDSLTTWRMVAVGLTPETRVGNATTETIARKKVLVRLQAPRFFRERDTLVLSANVHNYTAADAAMDVTLRATGISLEGATTMPLQGNEKFVGTVQRVTVPAGGEKRVDFNATVASADMGEAILNLMATSAVGSDALQTTVPLLPHGIDKFVAWNGTSQDEASTGVAVTVEGGARVITQTVSLPAERIRETSRLEIQVNPSLASSIREALPYMIDYPYGCVEQTMSRFMPAAVAARAFQVLGYPLDKTLQEKLPQVTADGLKRLRDMQLPQGGWGWWANDSENLNMTAYVMQGLTLARDAEVTVDAGMFDRGLRRLGDIRDDVTSKTRDESKAGWWYSNNLHSLMYAEYVLTLNGQSSPRTIDLLWGRRDELTARGLAMLARTMAKLGRQADAELVLRNMMNVAVVTPENHTMRWGKTEGAWWWYDDAVESTAVGLMAYLDISPDDPAVDQAVKWLVLNRQGNRWKSTRDSAHAVLALTQYMLQRNEAAKPVKIEVRVGERLVKTLDVNPQNFWDFDGKIVLRGDEIPDGDFPVSFAVSGEGRIYYSVFAEYFTLEENIKKAGNEIYVTRSYEKLSREQTTETVKGAASTIFKDKWLPVNDGDELKSGDELRVTLKIKSLNDYEYLVFEDPKPAGMEPVDLQSGGRYGNGLCSNMELRDKWVAFFFTTLRQGEHSISYNVRAEIPGTFHAMPTTGHAMYFPPLRANSDEAVLKVSD